MSASGAGACAGLAMHGRSEPAFELRFHAAPQESRSLRKCMDLRVGQILRARAGRDRSRNIYTRRCHARRSPRLTFKAPL